MIERAIKALFKATFGTKAHSLAPIQAHASSRRLFRVTSARNSVIGVYGPDPQENAAFIGFSKHFRSKNLPVPDIFAVNQDLGIYLEEDLGDETLLGRIQSIRGGRIHLPHEARTLYKNVLDDLIRFQLDGIEGFPIAICTPSIIYDRKAMLGDLYSFKYSFLKLLDLSFDEEYLDDDFESIVTQLTRLNPNDIIHTDFQGRNIMLHEGRNYYIDYQNARIGPPQYDVASLLYQGSACLSRTMRDALYEYFVDSRIKLVELDRSSFREDFHRLILLFLLKALGTYGLRGLTEGKSYFMQGIPLAVANLYDHLARTALGDTYPEIQRIAHKLNMRYRDFVEQSF